MPIVPNMGPQAEAMAGASAMIFTSTDREIIRERAGEIDRNRSFREIFSNREFTPKVENEQTTVNPEVNIATLESRQRDYKQIIRNSVLTVPREKVMLTKTEETQVKTATDMVETTSNEPPEKPKAEIHPETAALVKQLNLDPHELFDKFRLEQDELHSLIYRIKELHLKRLLCGGQHEFEQLSNEIKKETLASGLPEAKGWLEDQLNKLTHESAEYKLKLLESLQALEFDSHRDANIKWLKELTKVS